MKLKLLSLMLVVLLVFSACGGTKDTDTSDEKTDDTSASQEESTEAKESVTLTLLANQDWVTKPYMMKAWQKYEEVTGNKLDIQAVPVDSGESIMKTKFATGEIPDIFMHFGGYGLTAYQPEKNFVDFSDAEWKDDIQPYVLPQAMFEGKVYGLPHWEASISGILYNTEIFDELGLEMPNTQDEFMAACKTIKEAGMTPVYLAFKDVWPLLYQFGMDNIVLDDVTLMKLNSNEMTYSDIPEFQGMLEWYKEMADLGYFGEDYATNTWDGAPTALGEGKAAMMIAWDSYVSSDLEPKYEGISEKFSIMPAFMNVVDQGSYEGPNVCLTFANKNGQNVEAAIEFINFMADPENYNDAFDGYGTAPVFINQSSNISTNVYVSAEEVINKKAVASTAWPSIIGFTQVEAAKYIQDMMIGNISVEECMEAMDNDRIEIAKAQQIPGFE